MHLIAPLAAGLVGCESGTFSIVRRGTSTPANYYTDFEGLTAPIVGTNIALDSRGGGVFYVNELVKVTCKSALGVTIREFIAGDEATCLDVRSDSFTGTHYQTAAVAAGNPITLKALLDKWDNSAGADDWQVLVNGAATNLSSAFAALQGQRRYVVTSYGALGDGVTNDTSAINAALSAANAAGGGVVFFPSGNYVCTTVTAFSGVTIEGSGPGQTTISLQTASQFFINGTMAGVVRGIRFTFLGGLGSIIGYLEASTVTSGQDYLVEDCVFVKKSDSTGSAVLSFTSSTSHRLAVNRCTIEIGAGRGISTGTGCDLRVFSTTIRAVNASGSGPQAFFTNTNNLQVVACTLDFSAHTSGVAQAFSSGSTGTTLAVGNLIIPPGTSVNWNMFNNGGSRVLSEAGNSTGLTTANWGSAFRVYTGVSAGSQLGSRQAAYVSLTTNADPVLLPLGDAAIVRLRVTDGSGWTANCTLQDAYASAPGLNAVVMIWNDTAGSLNFDAFWKTTGTFAVAANSVRVFALVSMLDASSNLAWFPVSDTAGALDAE